MTSPIRIQPLLRARLGSLGEDGAAWLASLPGILADLAQTWDLQWGPALPGGSAAYVVRARTAAHEERVVKVGLPWERSATATEAAVLRAAQGRGYVRLDDHHEGHGALLMEALSTSLERRPPGPSATLAALAGTLQVAWEVPTDDPLLARPELPTHRAEMLQQLIIELAARHPRHCAPRVLAHVTDLVGDLVTHDDPDRWVLCHGDPHPANALRRGPGLQGCVLIDPDGLWADPAYDLGIVLREWNATLQRAARPRDRWLGWADELSALTGLPAERIAAWSYVERVSTGLHVLDFGAVELARSFLDTADLLLRS